MIQTKIKNLNGRNLKNRDLNDHFPKEKYKGMLDMLLD